MGAPAATEPPSVTLSFANNFWGKDDAGVSPMLERMHNAKVTSDELKSFYAARAAIEDEYSRKLLNLARKPLGSSESGTLRMSFDVIRGEVESMGKAHQSVAQQMKTELEEPLQAFAGGMKERRKIVQNGIEKLLKMKMQQTAAVNKARDRYENDCLKIKGFLAQAHMVMGQEERKNKAKLEKTQIQLSDTERDYEAAVKILEETTGRWNRDWKGACDKFQDLEEERIDYTKSSLWNFANIASTVCVSDDAACEKIRLSLEDCDVEKDITNFIQGSGTGQEIPDPPKFINFARGDADTASQTSEDENFSVAQFARTMNPAYRASSPAPSSFDSHNDPNNPLARELLGNNTKPIPQDQINVPPQQAQPARPAATSRASHHSERSARAPQPDPRLIQAQQQAHQQYQQSKIPHNDFPQDGMTQFCRVAAPSDQSAMPSPIRPSSRDSQSDYSNPTSFSSIEPPSGSASPGKPMFESPQSPEEMSVQQKKGFFSKNPFARRQSKPDIQPPASITPSSRNTWGPASRSTTNENVSPTRPYASKGRGTVLKDVPTPSPEPVDPRANFQLNIGNNVFDVASPDGKKEQKPNDPQEELDPIAQALAELKGVTKQTSLRVSADRYHGLATPQPPATPAVGANLPGGAPTPLVNASLNAAKRGTPPPSYDAPPMSRLGAPKPAHTARQMQKTTEMYVQQKASVFNTGSSSRPPTRGTVAQEAPRAASPAPRAASPQPSMYRSQQQQPSSPAAYRAASPNPYAGGRPRAQTASQTQAPNPYGNPTARGSYSRQGGGSPGMPRAASPQPPQPQYAQSRPGSRAAPTQSSPQPAYANARPASRAAPTSRAASPNPQFRQSYDRPSSSRGSDMALQLAPGPGSERGDGSVYGGSVRGRSGTGGQRPQSSYYGGGGASDLHHSPSTMSSRVRSKSVAEPRQYTRDGRMILHYSRAMYMYAAQIPEELTFAKGDILAVLRLQDDGWWEAEVVGKDGRRGLVPSNYLQNC
ncbi:formin-binding protein [Paraconiothyrium brasiliense]|uniref:Formin-binding protein n=1 Tax=Paraconiothyrium brasiliense TaxID=300254 RepID=A0ABR3S093_9PLEO